MSVALLTTGVLCAGLAGNPVAFTDVTSPLLADPNGGAKGAAWGDVNGDGLLDLLWMNTDAAMPRRLAIQQPDHTFVLSEQPWLEPDQNHSMPVLGDLDNDGDLDLFFANWSDPVRIIRNNGGLDFSPIVVTITEHRSRGTALADADNDGFLDAFISTQATSAIGEDKIYFGNGTTMTDVTPPGFDDQDRGRGVVWADFDDDGDLDIYQAHGNGCPCDWEVMPEDWVDAARNRMWRNDGGGVFTDVTDAVTGDTNNGRGIAVGDVDNDGDLDIFIANLAIEGAIEGPDNIGAFGGQNRLLRNDGNFVFTDITPAILADDESQHRSCALIDFDNDGDLDLHLMGISGTPAQLFRNRGANIWSDDTPAEFLGNNNGRANPWGDYDGDGDLDVFLTHNSENRLLRNDQDSGKHWVIVNLVGTTSNRSAIGARVTVDVTINGTPRSQIREVIAGSGYWSQNQLAPHFGLSIATTIDRITVRWPSGREQIIEDLDVDQYVTVVEGIDCADLSGGAIDCDGNGINDECDLLAGTAADCNENGIPDSCDIADETSLDDDGNGIPDECETPAPPCTGDADGDRVVGFQDVLRVLEFWGPCPGCAGDLDGDGEQGFSDLLMVLEGWGPCPE